jgi:zinc/manganese transport system substrate-binding protein
MFSMRKLAIMVEIVVLSLPILCHASAGGLKVVATFSIIGDFAKQVGGDRIELTTLIGPHGDAHVYEPKPADVIAISSADIVLVNGLQFEGFLQRLVKMGNSKTPVVELSKGSRLLRNTKKGHDHDNRKSHDSSHDHHHKGHHHHGKYDPHAWQSVRNAMVYVNNVADAFCVADPAGCTTYRANTRSYLRKLRALDEEVRAIVTGIPESKKTVITSHDAFGYFAYEYGIRFLAPLAVSTESEASAADIATLIRQIRKTKAAAIFVENITNPRLVEQIASETGLQVSGELYSDALSDESGPAATYIAMMQHNITTIRSAIAGTRHGE